MKKRYYLSMLNLYPLVLAFDGIYFVSHQSLKMFLTMALTHFDQREPSIGFSHSLLYLQSDSVNEYFPPLEIL
jgi:hypothetical protein